MLQDKVVDVFLDSDGMKAFEGLSQTRLAPFISNISVGVHRIAHLKDGVSFAALTKQTKAAGFKVADEALGCRLFDHEADFSPSADVIKRFAEALKQFLNIRNLSSCEEVKHGQIVMKDETGKVRTTITVKLPHDMPGHHRSQAHCICRRYWNDDDFDEDRRIICKSVRSMFRFLVFDLARVHNEASANAAFFSNLKAIQLNLPNSPNGKVCTEADEIAEMLFECTVLEDLTLWTKEPDKATTAGQTIERILHKLTTERRYIEYDVEIRSVLSEREWGAKLKSLQLSSVNPCCAPLLAVLSKQMALEFLRIKNCKEYRNSADDLRALWLVLQRLPRLSLCFEDFRTTPRNAPEVKRCKRIVDVSGLPSVLKHALSLTSD